MKKIQTVLSLLFILLLGLLCACSSTPDEDANTSRDEASQQTEKAADTEEAADAEETTDTQETISSESASTASGHVAMTLSAEERSYWEDVYATILTQYYNAIAEGWDEDDIDGTFVNSLCLYEDLDSIGYIFTDLDNDGVCELLIGYVAQEDEYSIGLLINVYRLDEDDNVVSDWSSHLKDRWMRLVFLCEGNIIKAKAGEFEYNIGFSGDLSYLDIDIGDYANNLLKFLMYEEYYEDFEYDTPWLYMEISFTSAEGEYQAVTEEKAQEIMDEYDALQAVYIDFVPLSEYVTVNLPIDDAGYLYQTDEDSWIEDGNGNITASMSNGDFDEVLAYGDGYYMLYRDSSGFDEAVQEIGVVKYDGTWPWEYETIDEMTGITSWTLYPASYIGEGVFVLYKAYETTGRISGDTYADVLVMSCLNNNKYNLSNVMVVNYSIRTYETNRLTWYEYDDYLASVVVSSEYVHLEQLSDESTSKNNTIIFNIFTGEILVDLGNNVSSIGDYSDGGFVYRQSGQLYFFDCGSREITAIYLEDSDKFSGCSYQFVDGEMEIWLEGADGNTYYATIDKSGNYIVEPHLEN